MKDGGAATRGSAGLLVGIALSGAALAALAWALLAFQSRSLVAAAQAELAAQVAADADFAAALIGDQASPRALPALAGRRITLVAADGRVLADSAENPAAMDNHADRPEIVAARATGRGSSRRRSETLGRTLVYEARALADGGVLRIAAPLPEDGGRGAAASSAVLASSGLVVALCWLIVIAHLWRGRARARELREVAADFAAGHFARRASLTSRDALGAVGHELNALGARLQATLADLDGQRRLLDGALGALGEGVACLDRLDRVVYANAAYRRLAAGEREVVGQPYYEHLPSARLEAPLAAARGAAPAPPVEFAHRGRELAATAAPGGPEARVLVLRDLTELKRLEGARRDVLAAVSHEFKTPLTAIAGFTETLLDGALDDPATARSFVDKIARHAERLGALVRDVLALARIEQGAWTPRPERSDLARLAEAVLEEAQPAAAERGVALRLEAPPSLPATTDPEMLRQIIGNLVSNGVRYNRPDGTVRLRLARGDDALRIAVEDTGIGIPPEHQERVFERFYRIDAHRSRQTGGTGLGLAIVKHLVGLLGGSIELTSGAHGTRFELRLPLAAADAAQAAPAPGAPAAPASG